MDGASQSQLHRVMFRFGVTHKLIDPPHRAWIHAAVLSELDLPDRFFIGHHFKLQESIFETSLKRSQPSPAPQEIGPWEYLKRLLWMKPSRQTPREGTRGRKPRRPESRKPGASSPWKVRRAAEEAKAQANRRATTPSKSRYSGETGTLANSPPGNSGEVERAAGPQEMTEEQDLVETKEVSKGSTSDASTPEATKPEAPTPTKRKLQATRSEQSIAAGKVDPRAIGTQGSDKASEEQLGPGLSKKDGAQIDAAKQVLSSEVAAVKNKLEILKQNRLTMQNKFRELRAAGKLENAVDLRIYKTNTEKQARVANHLEMLTKKLNTMR